MAKQQWNRRSFLASTAGGLGLATLLRGLSPVSGDDLKLDGGVARFAADVEPLVRFLEDTPREKLIEETARRVQDGLSYRHLLTALLLAGVRNVQPRPSVGFKFHAVLVVNSAHLAAISGTEQERWLPIFWAIDNFKESQERDVREGNWTLPAVEESKLPSPLDAERELREALEQWDEAKADVAISSLVRHHGANRVFEVLAEYAARDFRSIGHKVIYLSNATRTLETIGWEYAEPVMRSLVYAMLNHVGEPNPAKSDLEPDRAGRENRTRIGELKTKWMGGKPDNQATVDLIQTLHQANSGECSGKVVELLNRGVAVQSIWDGLFGGAAELIMRQQGIVSLHAVTTTNALHHAFMTAANLETRKFLLLQNASFLSLFRDAAAGRGALQERHIDRLESTVDSDLQGAGDAMVATIFERMGSDRQAAAQMAMNYLSQGGNPQAMVDHARRLVFLKGNDSHDYKFSSAALEDYRSLSPVWQKRFLATATFQLRSSAEQTRPLTQQIQNALEL